MISSLETVAHLVSGGRATMETLSWESLRYQHLQAIRTALADYYRPATCNKILAACRGVLRECWRLGRISAEEYHRAIDIDPVRGKGLPAGRAVSAGEIDLLLRTCLYDPSPAGTRDAAMIALLYAGGLRRAELVSLQMDHLDLEEGSVVIRSGKGAKARIVWIERGTKLYLTDWILLRGWGPGALFCPVDKGGGLTVRQMSPQAVRDALIKRADEAGVAHMTPHDLRRTWIGDLLDAGADIVTVRHLAGHASVDTTAAYDRRPEEAKKRAAGLLSVPYYRRRF